MFGDVGQGAVGGEATSSTGSGKLLRNKRFAERQFGEEA
jgi:hypothetical protein